MVRFRTMRLETRTRMWLTRMLLLGVFLAPLSARAQNAVSLTSLHVQLWPEYDQPSMLVIYDFELPEGIQLPVNVSIRIPNDANLIAVASQGADNILRNAEYLGPRLSGAWQTVTVQVQTPAPYHLEYYEPLTISGELRQFAYTWPGDYAVNDFQISVRMPADTTHLSADPELQSAKLADGTAGLIRDFGRLGAGQQLPLRLSYTKTSNALSVSKPKLEPSQPLNANTSGRVMLSNYWPYMLGVLGLVLISGGAVYFWQSGRGRAARQARRQRRAAQPASQAPSNLYCHQCGTRAQRGDRFCRVCGSKLRLPE